MVVMRKDNIADLVCIVFYLLIIHKIKYQAYLYSNCVKCQAG